MALRYGLILNHLTDAPDDYMGLVTDSDTITTEQIVARNLWIALHDGIAFPYEQFLEGLFEESVKNKFKIDDNMRYILEMVKAY